jgi:hypothetical protein
VSRLDENQLGHEVPNDVPSAISEMYSTKDVRVDVQKKTCLLEVGSNHMRVE